jgi:hypothetical protein
MCFVSAMSPRMTSAARSQKPYLSEYLVTIREHTCFAARYIRHNEAERLKIIDKLVSNNTGIIESNMRAEMLLQRDLLRAKKASGEIKSMKVWKIAEAADMNEIYCTVYAHLSLSVHASPQDMARRLLTDESGKITHLIWGPTHEESQVMLRYGMLLLWACVGALGDLFQLDISAKLDSVIQRNQEIDGTAKDARIDPLTKAKHSTDGMGNPVARVPPHRLGALAGHFDHLAHASFLPPSQSLPATLANNCWCRLPSLCENTIREVQCIHASMRR